MTLPHPLFLLIQEMPATPFAPYPLMTQPYLEILCLLLLFYHPTSTCSTITYINLDIPHFQFPCDYHGDDDDIEHCIGKKAV